MGAAVAQQGPAPIPVPRRRAAQQLLGPPPSHPPAQPEPEEEAREGPCLPEVEELLQPGAVKLLQLEAVVEEELRHGGPRQPEVKVA